MMRLGGGCHCGAVRYDVELTSEVMPIRVCGCTFCVAHAAAWTSDPDGKLEVEIVDSDQVNRYRFGTESADFCICRRCGVVPFAVSRIDARLYAVVNTNTLDDRDSVTADRMTSDFEGEVMTDRLARRRANWIADVRGIATDEGDPE